MSAQATSDLRFAFGRNWQHFVRRNLTEERITIARNHLLSFLRRADLSGLDFLDIGCGSGINSAAALSAGASPIHSFDYDPDSVAATELVQRRARAGAEWHLTRGDVLDDGFIHSLGKWKLVYSWGVLHHTGDVWKAIDNASKTVADNGLFYIALYSADTHSPEMQKYWLAIKRQYSAAPTWRRVRMYCWHLWHRVIGQDRVRGIYHFVRDMWSYKKANRGMSLLVDIHDWLGGWPMEFTRDADVIAFVQQRGFELENINAGGSLTEFLFRKRSEHI